MKKKKKFATFLGEKKCVFEVIVKFEYLFVPLRKIKDILWSVNSIMVLCQLELCQSLWHSKMMIIKFVLHDLLSSNNLDDILVDPISECLHGKLMESTIILIGLFKIDCE